MRAIWAALSASALLASPTMADWSGYASTVAGTDSGSISQGRWVDTGAYGYHRRYTKDFKPADQSAELHVAGVFDSGLGLQLDVRGARFLLHHDALEPYPEMHSSSTYGAAVHLNQRSPDFLYGGYLAMGRANKAGWLALGPEAQAYLGRFTASAQASFTHAFDGRDAGENTYALHTGLRWFATDDLAFSAGAGGAISDYNDITHPSRQRAGAIGHSGLVQWNASAEYLLPWLPVSVVATYRGDRQLWREIYPSPTVSFLNRQWKQSNAILVGLRVYLGQTSLIEHERKGAGLDDFNPWFGAEPAFADHDRAYYGPPF